PPCSALFPYTTLFRSLLSACDDLRKRQFVSAGARYQQALQLAPDSATLHLAYAVDLLSVKDYARAESEARRSLQLWADDAEAHRDRKSTRLNSSHGST